MFLAGENRNFLFLIWILRMFDRIFEDVSPTLSISRTQVFMGFFAGVWDKQNIVVKKIVGSKQATALHYACQKR